MDFIQMYHNLNAKYEEGIEFDIKAFFEGSEEVEDYSIIYLEDGFEITIKNLKNNADMYIFNFLCCVSYRYLCVVHKERTEKCDVYYIYTKMNDKKDGIKIRINVY